MDTGHVGLSQRKISIISPALISSKEQGSPRWRTHAWSEFQIAVPESDVGEVKNRSESQPETLGLTQTGRSVA